MTDNTPSNVALFCDSLRLAVSAPPHRIRDAVKLAEHFASRLTPAEITQAKAQIAGEVAAEIQTLNRLASH